VSQQSPLPRVLAALLGVEPAAPSGAPVTVSSAAAAAQSPPSSPRLPGPQQGAQQEAPQQARSEVPPSSMSEDARARLGRRPDPLAQRKEPEVRAPRAPRAVRGLTEVPRAAAAAPVSETVRRTLATASALRAAVVAAEVLGPPRALRPFGDDGRG
jgi:hypothetical protein